WSEISPTIFGGVFESTLNPETRRSGGMHYTSIENIHKVIDPLFYNGLLTAFESCKEETNIKKRLLRLHELQDQMAQLRFFDPACGSGNFLTETYLSLRRLENEIIKQIYSVEQLNAFENPIKVNIHQFYGIEINDFAVTVATTALWISEAQMMAETEKIIHHDIDFLPLKSYANIHEGNSLRIAWEEVCPKDELDYIIGNPPFVGARMMEQGSEQKKDVQNIFGNIKDVQDLDYVCCWYKKAAEIMKGTKIETALVSTNSISQGVQVPILWNVLYKDFNVHINFAYPTFKWTSESSNKAAVHCVIVGFAWRTREEKCLYYTYDNGVQKHVVSSISPYLTEGNEMTIESHKTPLCDVPKMCFGNQPRDGGHFVISPEEREEIVSKNDGAEKFLRPYMGAEEFIKGKKRWCLWLNHATPAEIKHSPTLYAKVKAVQEMRLASRAKTTNGYAKVPHLFAQMTQPEGADYIIVPAVSSERRKYIPMGFMPANVVSSNAVQIIPNATLYHFGILESNVHMAWMRAVCGRLKSDYRYSKDVVYNNFPWPTPTAEQKAKIEQSAQAILDARALYPDSSLADLYDPTLMPKELLQAHRQNDRTVMAAYGFSTKMTESECVAELFKRYSKLAE
ncbi:MAG: N-6 DNA methylase, partial [Prevotella sp.]|nr:N-6 DNA methylase [Prevotella sp.]